MVRLFGAILINLYLSKNCSVYFLGNFLEIGIHFSHTVGNRHLGDRHLDITRYLNKIDIMTIKNDCNVEHWVGAVQLGNWRWRLVSTQLSSKFVCCPSRTVSFVLAYHKHNSLSQTQQLITNTTAYHFYCRFDPSSSTTKELHNSIYAESCISRTVYFVRFAKTILGNVGWIWHYWISRNSSLHFGMRQARVWIIIYMQYYSILVYAKRHYSNRRIVSK